MAQKTTLGILGLPGPIHVFVAKDPAPVGGPHNPGHITTLAVYGLPGRLHTFTPKAPGVPGGPHDPGRITALMVYAVPGRTQSFIAKRAPIVIPVRRQFFHLEGSSKTKYRRYFIVEEN